MKKLMSLIMIVAISSVAFGGTFTNAVSENWGDAANWGGTVPNDYTTFPGDVIPAWLTDAAIASSTTLTYTAADDWHIYDLRVAQYGTTDAVMNMSGGSLKVGIWDFQVGRGKGEQHGATDGELNMSGGYIGVGAAYMVPDAWDNSETYTGTLGLIQGVVNQSGYSQIRAIKMEVGQADGVGTVTMSGHASVVLGQGGLVMNTLSSDETTYGTYNGGSIVIDDQAYIKMVGIGDYVDPGTGPTEAEYLQAKIDTMQGFIDVSWITSNDGPVTVSYDAGSDMITIPEPATMMLLGLGGLLIRRKR